MRRFTSNIPPSGSGYSREYFSASGESQFNSLVCSFRSIRQKYFHQPIFLSLSLSFLLGIRASTAEHLLIPDRNIDAGNENSSRMGDFYRGQFARRLRNQRLHFYCARIWPRGEKNSRARELQTTSVSCRKLAVNR